MRVHASGALERVCGLVWHETGVPPHLPAPAAQVLHRVHPPSSQELHPAGRSWRLQLHILVPAPAHLSAPVPHFLARLGRGRCHTFTPFLTSLPCRPLVLSRLLPRRGGRPGLLLARLGGWRGGRLEGGRPLVQPGYPALLQQLPQVGQVVTGVRGSRAPFLCSRVSDNLLNRKISEDTVKQKLEYL